MYNYPDVFPDGMLFSGGTVREWGGFSGRDVVFEGERSGIGEFFRTECCFQGEPFGNRGAFAIEAKCSGFLFLADEIHSIAQGNDYILHCRVFLYNFVEFIYSLGLCILGHILLVHLAVP